MPQFLGKYFLSEICAIMTAKAENTGTSYPEGRMLLYDQLLIDIDRFNSTMDGIIKRLINSII